MTIHVVRLGSPRLEAEGLRIGTVRRPPRGVPKDEFASRDFYDVWLPELVPAKSCSNSGKRPMTKSAGARLQKDTAPRWVNRIRDACLIVSPRCHGRRIFRWDVIAPTRAAVIGLYFVSFLPSAE